MGNNPIGRINEILPFALEGTVEDGDILTLEDYYKEKDRKEGFESGLADRSIQNTFNRQMSVFVTGTAEFLAGVYAPGIVDDGNIYSIENAWTSVFDTLVSEKIDALESWVLDMLEGIRSDIKKLTTNFDKKISDLRTDVDNSKYYKNISSQVNANIYFRKPEKLFVENMAGKNFPEAVMTTDKGYFKIDVNSNKNHVCQRFVCKDGLEYIRFASVLNERATWTRWSSLSPTTEIPGDIKLHYDTKAPVGWFPCNNMWFDRTIYPELFKKLGRDRTPDMRGLVVRGYDPDNKNDPDGSRRSLGSFQGDAMRNITGRFGGVLAQSHYANGAFVIESRWGLWGRGGEQNLMNIAFDASRQVPTAPEFRGKNINLPFYIKHDNV